MTIRPRQTACWPGTLLKVVFAFVMKRSVVV
jgi:hypothetical protein